MSEASESAEPPVASEHPENMQIIAYDPQPALPVPIPVMDLRYDEDQLGCLHSLRDVATDLAETAEIIGVSSLLSIQNSKTLIAPVAAAQSIEE